jgi:hypothetical protein
LYQPPPGYELKKNRRKWPWVLGALLLIIMAAVNGAGGTGSSPARQAFAAVLGGRPGQRTGDRPGLALLAATALLPTTGGEPPGQTMCARRDSNP